MIKRITLVTNYFPPEKGAAANRIHSLALALAEYGFQVHIVCPFPNYPKGKIFEGYKGRFYNKTIEDNLTISRLWVSPSNSQNKFLRLLSMLSFSFSLSLFFIFKRFTKRIIIQYSPVFVGFTAVFWSWIFRKKIILNISDLWPLAGLEMGLLQKGFYYSILKKMELFCCFQSKLILGQSEEILSYVQELGYKKDCFLYRNIPNFETPQIPNRLESQQISIVYAGLLGIAQGLLDFCEQIELPSNITFHIYGAGPEEESIKAIQSDRIIFHGEVNRTELHRELRKYDIAFIPLINRIYGSVPSKIFEYTRIGLPVLYFAGGEGEEIVKKYGLGWTIQANNMDSLQAFFNTLTVDKLSEFSKYQVQKNSLSEFDFDSQFKEFVRKIEIF